MRTRSRFQGRAPAVGSVNGPSWGTRDNGRDAPLAGVRRESWPEQARPSASELARERAAKPAPMTPVRNGLIWLPPHRTVVRQSKEKSPFGFSSRDRLSPFGRFLGRQDCENSLLHACQPGRFESLSDRDELGEAVQFGQTGCAKARIKARVRTTSRRHISPDQSADLLLATAQD